MRIKKFQARKMHGYMDFDIIFFDDISFLIGINGTGKTTAVRTIHAMLSPNLLVLAMTDFEDLNLTIINDDREVIVKVWRDSSGFFITTSHTESKLHVPNFEPPPNEPSFRYNDLSSEYYRSQQAFHADHDVFKFIRSMPTPMFLGLERRAAIEGGALSRRIAPRGRQSVFGGNLAESLLEASELAANFFRLLQDKEDKLKDNLRNSLLLRAFEFADIDPFSMDIKYPSREERSEILSQRARVKDVLVSLGLSEKEIESQVNPFFEKMKIVIGKLPSARNKTADGDAALSWLLNKWQYERIQSLTRLVDAYVAERRALFSSADSFVGAVNDFFRDNGKKIILDRYGLRVSINGMKPRSVVNMSSGEQQLLVLLTHLAFNPAAQEANILIIDEPEISLHIAWQEMFADALLKSNPNIQFILATHSPSIVLDRDENCIELGDQVANQDQAEMEFGE